MVKSTTHKTSRTRAMPARRHRKLPPAATPQLGANVGQAAPAPAYILTASPWYNHQAYHVTDSLAPRYSYEARGFATEPEQLINEFADEFTLVESLLGLLTDLQKLKHPHTTPNILATATAQYLLSLNRWATHQGVGMHLTGGNLQGQSIWQHTSLSPQVGRLYGALLDPHLAFNQRLLCNIALYTLADYTNLSPQRLSHFINQEMHLGHTRLMLDQQDAAFFNYNSESFRSGMHAHWTAYAQEDGSYHRISNPRYQCFFEPQTKILPESLAFWSQFKSIDEQPLRSLAQQRKLVAQGLTQQTTAKQLRELGQPTRVGVVWRVAPTIANGAYAPRGVGFNSEQPQHNSQLLFYATSYHSLVHLIMRLASDSTLAPLVASLTPVVSEIRKTTQGAIPAHLRERLIKSLFQRYLEMAIGVDSTKQQFAISHAEQSWGLLGLPLVMLMLLQPWTKEQRGIPLHDIYKVFAVDPQARQAEYVTRVATLLSYVNYRAQAEQLEQQWLNWQRIGSKGQVTIGDLTTLVSVTSKFYDYAQQYLREIEAEIATATGDTGRALASANMTSQESSAPLASSQYLEFLQAERVRLYRELGQALSQEQLLASQGVRATRGRFATTVGLGNYNGLARKRVKGQHLLGGVHPHLLQPVALVRPPLLAATQAQGSGQVFHAVAWDFLAHGPSVVPTYNSWQHWISPCNFTQHPLLPASGATGVRELCFMGIVRALQHSASAHLQVGRTSRVTRRLGLEEVPAWADRELSPFWSEAQFIESSYVFSPNLDLLYAALDEQERQALSHELQEHSAHLGTKHQLPATPQDLTSVQAMLEDPMLFYLRNSLWSRYTNLELRLLRQVATCYKYLADQQITMPVFIEMMNHAHALLDSVYYDPQTERVVHNEHALFKSQTTRLESYLAQHPIPAFNSQTFIEYFLPYQHKLETYLEHMGISQGEVRALELHGLSAGYKILERLVQLDLHHHLSELRQRLALLNWKGLDLERYLPENLAPQLQPSEQEIHGIVLDVVSNYSRLLERTLQLDKIPKEKRAHYATQVATLNQNLAIITKRCEEVFAEMNMRGLGVTSNGHLNGVEFEVDVHYHKGEYLKRLQTRGAVDNRHALRYAIANMFYERQHELLVEAGVDIGKPNEPHGFGFFTQMAEHLFGTSLREIPVPAAQRRVQNLVHWLAIQPRQAQVLLEDIFEGQMRGVSAHPWSYTPYELDQVELWADYQSYRAQLAQAQARYFQPLQPQFLSYQLDSLQSFLVSNNLALPHTSQLPGQQLLGHNVALQTQAELEKLVAEQWQQAPALSQTSREFAVQAEQAASALEGYLRASVQLDAQTSQKLLRNLTFLLPTQQTVAQHQQQMRYLASWFAARDLSLPLAGADSVVELREALYRTRARLLEARRYSLQQAHPALAQASMGDAWAIAFVARHPEIVARGNLDTANNTQGTGGRKAGNLPATSQDVQQAREFDSLNARFNDLLDADAVDYCATRELAPERASVPALGWQPQLAGELSLAGKATSARTPHPSSHTDTHTHAALGIPASQLGILPGWQTPADASHLRFDPSRDLEPIYQAIYQGLVNLTDGEMYYLLPHQLAHAQALRRNCLGNSYLGLEPPCLHTQLPRPVLRQFYSSTSAVRPQGLSYSLEQTQQRYTALSLQACARFLEKAGADPTAIVEVPQSLAQLVSQVAQLDPSLGAQGSISANLGFANSTLAIRGATGIPTTPHLDAYSLSRALVGYAGSAALESCTNLNQTSLRCFYASWDDTQVQPASRHPHARDLRVGQSTPVALRLRSCQGKALEPDLLGVGGMPTSTELAHADLSVWFEASAAVAPGLALDQQDECSDSSAQRESLGWKLLTPVAWLQSGAQAMRAIYNRAIYMARQQLRVAMQLQAQAWFASLSSQGLLEPTTPTTSTSYAPRASLDQLGAWRDALAQAQVAPYLQKTLQASLRGLEQTLRGGTQLTTQQLTAIQTQSYRQATALGAQQQRHTSNYALLARHYRTCPLGTSCYQFLHEAGLDTYLPVAGSLLTLAPDLTRFCSASEQELLLQVLHHYANPNLATADLLAEFTQLANRYLLREVEPESAVASSELEASEPSATAQASSLNPPARQASAQLVAQLTLTPVTAPGRQSLFGEVVGEQLLAQLSKGEPRAASEASEPAPPRAAVFSLDYELGARRTRSMNAARGDNALLTPGVELELVPFAEESTTELPETDRNTGEPEYVTLGKRKFELVSFAQASAAIQAAVAANQLEQSAAQLRAAQERQRNLAMLQVDESRLGTSLTAGPNLLRLPHESQVARLRENASDLSELALSHAQAHGTEAALATPEAMQSRQVYLPYSVALHRRHYQQLFERNRLAAYACLQLDGYALWRGAASAPSDYAWNQGSLLEFPATIGEGNLRGQYAHLVQRIARVATGLQELSCVAPLFVRPTPVQQANDRLELVPYFAPSWLHTLVGLAQEWQRQPCSLQESWIAARVALEGYVANPTTPYHQLFRLGWLQEDSQSEQQLNRFLKWFEGQMPEFPEGDEVGKLADGSLDFASLPASKFKLSWLQTPEFVERNISNALQRSQAYQLTPHSKSYYRSYVQTSTRAQEAASYSWITYRGRRTHEEYAGFFSQARRVVRYVNGFIAQAKQRALQAEQVRYLQQRSEQTPLWWLGHGTNLAQLQAQTQRGTSLAQSLAWTPLESDSSQALASSSGYNLNPSHQAVLQAQLKQRQQGAQRLFDSYSLLLHMPFALQTPDTVSETRLMQSLRTKHYFEEIRLVPNQWKLQGLHNYTYEHAIDSAEHVLQGWKPEHPLDPSYHGDKSSTSAAQLQELVHGLLVAQQRKQQQATGAGTASAGNRFNNIAHSSFFLLYAKQLASLAGQDRHVANWTEYAGQLAARLEQLHAAWGDSQLQAQKLSYLQSFAYLQNFSLRARGQQQPALTPEQLTDRNALYAAIDAQAWQETLTSLASLPLAQLQLLQELPRYANLALNLVLVHETIGAPALDDNATLQAQLGLNEAQLELTLRTAQELLRNPTVFELVRALKPGEIVSVASALALQREFRLNLCNAILSHYFLNAGQAQREAYATLLAWAQQASYHALALQLLGTQGENPTQVRQELQAWREGRELASTHSAAPSLAWDAVCDISGVVRALREQLVAQEVQADYRSYGAHVLEILRALFGNPCEVRQLRLSDALVSAQTLLAQVHPNLMRHAIALSQDLLEQAPELAQLEPWHYDQYCQVYQAVRLYVLEQVNHEMEIARALGRTTASILANSGVGRLSSRQAAEANLAAEANSQHEALLEVANDLDEASPTEQATALGTATLRPFEVEELFSLCEEYTDAQGRFASLALADYEPQFVIFNLVRLNCMRVAQLLRTNAAHLTAYQALDQLVQLFFTSSVTEVREFASEVTTEAQGAEGQARSRTPSASAADYWVAPDPALAHALATWQYQPTGASAPVAHPAQDACPVATQTPHPEQDELTLGAILERARAGVVSSQTPEPSPSEEEFAWQDEGADDISTASFASYEASESNWAETQEREQPAVPRDIWIASEDFVARHHLQGEPRELALAVEQLHEALASCVERHGLPITLVTRFERNRAWEQLSAQLAPSSFAPTGAALWELGWALRGRDVGAKLELMPRAGVVAPQPTSLHQLVAQVRTRLASYYEQAVLGENDAAQAARAQLGAELRELVAPYWGEPTSEDEFDVDWFANWVDPYQLALQYAGQEYLLEHGSRLVDLPSLESLYGEQDAQGLERYTSLRDGATTKQLEQLRSANHLTISSDDIAQLMRAWHQELQELQEKAAILLAELDQDEVHTEPSELMFERLQYLCTRLTQLRGMAYWAQSWNSYCGGDPRLGNNRAPTTTAMPAPDLEPLQAYVRERLELGAKLEPLLATLISEPATCVPRWSWAQCHEFTQLVAQSDHLPVLLWQRYYPELAGHDSSRALYQLLQESEVAADMAPTLNALAQFVEQRLTMVAWLYVCTQLAQRAELQVLLGTPAASELGREATSAHVGELLRCFWTSLASLQSLLGSESFLPAPTLLSWLASLCAWNSQVEVGAPMQTQLRRAIALLDRLHFSPQTLRYWVAEQALVDSAVRLELAKVLTPQAQPGAASALEPSASPWYALNLIRASYSATASYLAALAPSTSENSRELRSWYGCACPSEATSYQQALGLAAQGTPYADLAHTYPASLAWQARQELAQLATLCYDLPVRAPALEQRLATQVADYFPSELRVRLGQEMRASFTPSELYQLFTFNLDPRQIAGLEVDGQTLPGQVLLRAQAEQNSAQRGVQADGKLSPQVGEGERPAYVTIAQEYDRWGNPVEPRADHWLTWIMPHAPVADQYGLSRFRTGDLSYRPNQRPYSTELLRTQREPLFLDSYAPVPALLADGAAFMRRYHEQAVVAEQDFRHGVAANGRAQEPRHTGEHEDGATCYAAQVVLEIRSNDAQAARAALLDLFRLGALSQVLAQRAQAAGHASFAELAPSAKRDVATSNFERQATDWEVDYAYREQLELYQAQRAAQILRAQYQRHQERASQLPLPPRSPRKRPRGRPPRSATAPSSAS